MAEAKKKSSSKPDLATIGGCVLALGGIVGGLLLEKGSLWDIIKPTAAMIVLGGTFGAVLISTPLSMVMRALKRLKVVLLEETQDPAALIEEIIGYATTARKNGLVSLEEQSNAVTDPFLKKALTLAVDGTDIQEIRNMLELEIGLLEHHAGAEAKVFECAGGYSPTIGIIGAVLGLIQVMKNLANIEEVGKGIAVAFVATVYGVGVANLLLLPAGSKIKARAQHDVHMKELMVEGVVGIVEGLNPKLIRCKLEAYQHGEAPAGAAKAKKGAAPAAAPDPAQA